MASELVIDVENRRQEALARTNGAMGMAHYVLLKRGLGVSGNGGMRHVG